MWFLRSVDGKEFFLLPGLHYVVGRKDNDLILNGDNSISRRHATLSVSTSNSGNVRCAVTLCDLKSKYGTFIQSGIDGWKKMEPESPKILGNGEVIRFGTISNTWTLKICIVSPSSLTLGQKTALSATLAAVGAEFSAGWKEQCTHLTMNSVTLTVKAVCALALGIPIVTPEFWRRFDTPAKQNLPEVLTRDFIPPLGENSLDASRVSLDVIEGRRHLFAGMRFIFANREQLKKLGCLVTSAGGEAVAYDARTFSFRQLCEPNTVLINIIGKETQELLAEYTAALAYSEAHGRRKIPESEIGLAVLDCSVERHCNPLYRPVSSLLRTLSLESQTQLMMPEQANQVLAFETQDSHHQENIRNVPKNFVIPESGSSSKDEIKRETQDETPDIFTDHTGLTYTEKENRKRPGDAQNEEPCFKKPTAASRPSISLFTGETSTARDYSEVDEMEDSKECLSLNLDAGQGFNDDEDDPFNFSRSSRSRPSRKRASSAKDDDDDLFGSLQSVKQETQDSEEVQSRLEPDEDEDMFATDETDNAQVISKGSVNNMMKPVDVSNMGRKARKVIKIDESNETVASSSNTKYLQKSYSMSREQDQQNEITSDNEKSDLKMSKISLKGFLSVMKVAKREPMDLDELQDAVECLVVVEKKPLVVRQKPPAAAETSVSSSAPVNFKRFRKVMPVPCRQTIVINRSSTFPVENVGPLSDEEDMPAASQQCFDFVSKKRKR